MATRFVLPSGQEVTRAWNGDGFRFELHTVTGPPVALLPEDIAELGRLVELGGLKDADTFEETKGSELRYEKVDE